jgi:hypothetical protein
VGPGRTYADPAQACRNAGPGDTVSIGPGTYRGTFWIENMQGTAERPIVIRGEDRATVIFDGGSESLHLSDCAWMIIENVTVRGQTGNGMNIDDAGTMATPAHHITVRDVTFTTMGAAGNNDFLKLSGLEDFTIERCSFANGAAGGSGIDMVGCHHGMIRENSFTAMGSNAIQAKGGTQDIEIRANTFIDCGQRAVNLGGSTGLEFFRPIDAPFEAADLRVYANLFVGGVTPIAYVGSVNVDVANNTIVRPTTWVFRVLQETVEPRERFEACGRNLFRNNLIVYGNGLRSHVNIGGNTAPETFTVRNNLWYNIDAPSSSRPNLGVMVESGGLYGVDPMCTNLATNDVRLRPGSPAIGAGVIIPGLGTDRGGRAFATPPSIGAFEGGVSTSVVNDADVAAAYTVSVENGAIVVRTTRPVALRWYDVRGRLVLTARYDVGRHVVAPLSDGLVLPVLHDE